MASALVVGTVASCALTELIRILIETTRSVRKCKPQCRKLEKELEEIKPDVDRLERRLGELRRRAFSADQEDIKMVEEWLERLKRAIDLANIEVHRCNSSRLQIDLTLSAKITSMHNEISKIAGDRTTLFLQLGLQLKDLIREETSQHGGPRNGSSHSGSSHSGSSHGGSSHGGYDYGGPNSGYLFSQDSSLHNYCSDSSGSSHHWGGFGDDSSVHSSSSDFESSGAAMLRLMSQQRNSILQQEDQTRLSFGQSLHYHHHEPHHERRHTIDSFHVTQPLPHAQSHHNRTSNPYR